MLLSDLKSSISEILDNWKFHTIDIYLNYDDYCSIMKKERPTVGELYYIHKDTYLQIGFSLNYFSVIIKYGSENIEKDHCEILINHTQTEFYIKVLTENERIIKDIIE